MKTIKAFLSVLLVSLAVPLCAQNVNEQQNKKNNSRASIEVIKGKNALVLKAGRDVTIDLKIDADTWRQLDSIVAGPWGSAIKLKYVDGYNVDVAKANVNSELGLMFTQGATCCCIKKEELDRLR